MQLEKFPALPVRDILQDLSSALDASRSAVLIAPPGAGKTTLVPLALLQAPWLVAGQKIIMLEPRRLAARAAAQRIAQLCGSKLGGTVGYRMRMDTKVSAETRIEIVTEGVFTRMILDDPELTGFGCVVFDEFHERSLDADFGLSLVLEAQSALRDDLRILVMSATLDGARVAELLGEGTPVIESAGRTFPVEKHYQATRPDERIEQSAARAVRQVLREHDGSILVFLPGRGEIERTRDLLTDVAGDKVWVAPLFGAMDLKDQALAIEPTPPGVRKVVLATAVAQTSITIDGVNNVIDSGLSREAVYEARFQTTRLETVRVSQATAEQRAGRAGRTAPGMAVRLWHEGQTRALRPFDPPEIERTDLRQFVLDCALWGASDPMALPLLDKPPPAALALARDSLVQLGALTEHGSLTDLGKQIARIALPVPLAAMVSAATNKADAEFRATVALIIIDLAPTRRETDAETILRDLENGHFGKRGQAIRQRAKALAGRLTFSNGHGEHATIGRVLLDAFPDRIAIRRDGQTGTYLMANGRGVRLEKEHRLTVEKFLVVIDVIGSAAQGRIVLAVAVTQADIEQAFAGRLEEKLVVKPTETGGLVARREKCWGAIALSSKPEKLNPGDELEDALCALVVSQGLGVLPFGDRHFDLLARLNWLNRHMGEHWIDFSDETLAAQAPIWLKPYMVGKTALSQLSEGELESALLARLPVDLPPALEDIAPSTYPLPTGRRAVLRYDIEKANPILSVRVQELFGLKAHPHINNGRTPLLIEMLSPAQRPIQMTLDLTGFWEGSWADVRKEMRGRYPKHVWPDDPASSEPTTRAKPRK
ncbi:MAG: ATP-dependent helicase HrpB [Pseudomonadota bacterium]